MKGKTALVTGSTGGIGEAFARAFAAEGCRVMLNGFGDAAAIERLRESIAAEHGVKVAYHDADVGVPSRIEDLVRATESRLGPVDILVTAKHALIGMTRGVALECAETGVTVNALMPGWVLTPHAEGQIARQMAADNVSREKALDALLKVRQPSQRPIMPGDIAAFGVFLCSGPGAHINGAALPIDGAWQSGFMLTAGNST